VTESFLGSVGEDERAAILKVAVRRRYARGEVVFHQGDLGDTFHIVLRGLLTARTVTPLGQVVTLNLFPVDAVFGELALLSVDARRAATVAALERSETLMIRRKDFADLRRRNPRMDAFLVAVLASRNRALSEHLTDLLFSPADERVYRRLLLLTDVATPGGSEWVKVTQEDVGSLAGTTRATVNRALRAAADAGTIELARGRFRILDRDALERRASR